MPYERARKIEMWFHQAVRPITEESLNARQLAAELGVSISTVQRAVAQLRLWGYLIRSVHAVSGWGYKLLDHHSPQNEEVNS